MRSIVCLLFVIFSAFGTFAQLHAAPTANIPQVIKFSGSAPPGILTATFAIYSSEDSAVPLWTESQVLSVDQNGHFSVILGSTSAEGLPASIFTSTEARWIGVRFGDSPEGPRSLMVSVPYALKAADAETLGGKPLSAFVLADPVVSPTPTEAAGIHTNVSKRLSNSSSPLGPPQAQTIAGTVNHLSKFLADGVSLGDSGLVEANGNVGIGTSTPGFPLELVGSNVSFLQRNPNASSYSGMRFYNDQASNVRALEIDYGGSAYPSVLAVGGPIGESASIATTGAFPMTLGTNNTARVTISGSGNVGIGTNHPAFPLELVGSNVSFLQRNPDPSSYSGMRFYNDQSSNVRALEIDYGGSAYPSVLAVGGPVGESASIATTGPFPLTLGTGNTARVTISGTGNVGIGTSHPAFPLELVGSNVSFLQRNPDPSSYSGMRFYNDQASNVRALEIDYGGSAYPSVLAVGGPVGESASIATTGPFPLTLGTSNTARIMISPTGNVGVGTIAPVAKLDVSQPSAGTDPNAFSVGNPPPSAIHGDTTATSGSIASIFGTTSSADGYGVLGENLASGTGTGVSAGIRGITANVSGASATTLGTGVWGDALQGGGDNVGVFGRSASVKGTGVFGQAISTTDDAVGVYGVSASSSGTGVFGEVTSASASTPIPAGIFGRAAAGVAGLFAVTNNSANLLIGQNASNVNVFRVDSTGKVFADGTVQASGADFAESVEVAEQKTSYEPGDVIAIDTTGVRRFAKSTQPYSTLVAGIYSTKPGVLATPHPIDDARVVSAEIPLAVVGIVPCKVTNENGDINAGDLLVSSSTAGYAMKGTDRTKMTAAVVGKALQAMHGTTGVIEVLVSLQ